MSPGRQLRYRLEAWSVHILLVVLSALPARAAIGLGTSIGWLAFRVWRSRRQVAVQNIFESGVCSDWAAAERMALDSFQAFTVMVVESVILRRRFTKDNWRNHVTLHGSEESRRLLETPGQPLLISSAHIGNWEAAIHVGSLIRPLVLVHRPLSNPYLERVVFEIRSDRNLSLLSSREPNPFRFLEAIGEGRILALMTDQHAAAQGVPVNFFGRPAWTVKTVAMMHLSTRVPLISAFCIRTGPLRYELYCTDPVEFERTGDREADAHRLTQILTEEVEKIAGRFPAQYMWGHKRWKT